MSNIKPNFKKNILIEKKKMNLLQQEDPNETTSLNNNIPTAVSSNGVVGANTGKGCWAFKYN